MFSAHDLTSLRAALSGRPKYKELSKKIGRYAAAQSFECDLKDCSAALATLQDESFDGQARHKFGRALMTQAIVMYCRAAIEDGSGRFKIGVTRDYTEQQKRNHQEIIKLRNNSIAHFGNGQGRYGQKWIDERVTLKISLEQTSLTMAYSRYNFSALLIHDLSDLCNAALARVKLVGATEGKELIDMIGALIKENADLIELLAAHRFDPMEFYQEEAPSKVFWENQGNVSHEVFRPKVVTAGESVSLGPSTAVRLKP